MSTPDFAPEQAADHLPQRRIVVVGVASLAITLVSIAAAGLLLRADRPDDARRLGPAPAPVRAPAEIGHVEQSLVESTRRGLDLQAQQRAALDRYGWVDRDAGIARIPIARAIDLTLERAR